MNNQALSSAIYPGSFDPVSFGHLDVIKRAGQLFSHVVVAVGNNHQKEYTFSIEDRVAMLVEATTDYDNIEVLPFEGLVVDFARKKAAKVLIRGLRMVTDFEYEFQMALTNRRLAEDIETLYLMPSEGYSFLSSSLIREVAMYGGDISALAPECVSKRLKQMIK